MFELTPYLPAGISIVALITWFVRLEGGIKEAKGKIHELEKRERDVQPIVRQIALDVATIKSDLSWLKQGRNQNSNINNNN